MRRLGLFLILSLLGACAQRPPQTPVAQGEAYFRGLGCIKCHSVGYDGGGAYGPDLTYIGFRKSKIWLDLWLKDPHSWKPNTVMPDFALPDDVRAALVAYLSEQKGQSFGPQKPWDAPEFKDDLVKRGAEIFAKAGCAGCHGVGGVGGQPNNNVAGGLIPSLIHVSEGYTKAELKSRIANGQTSDPADPSKPLPMLSMPAWKQVLSDGDLDALVAYLDSLEPKSAQAAGNSW